MVNATEPKLIKYVVASDAVVVTIGKKENGDPIATRVLRGGVVNGPEGSEAIADLLAMGSIIRPTSREHMAELIADLTGDPRKSKHRQTARKASLASGAPDDPVAAPLRDVLPAKFAPEVDVDGQAASVTKPAVIPAISDVATE